MNHAFSHQMVHYIIKQDHILKWWWTRLEIQVVKLFLSFVGLLSSFCIALSTLKFVTCVCFASCLLFLCLGPSLHTSSLPFAMYSMGREMWICSPGWSLDVSYSMQRRGRLGSEEVGHGWPFLVRSLMRVTNSFMWSGVPWLPSWSCARNIIRTHRTVPSLVTKRAKVNRVRPLLGWGHKSTLYHYYICHD